MTVHAMHQFTGELDLFTDRAILVGGRMGADGRVTRLSRGQFRRMLAAEPDVAEIVMRAFILRRAAFISHGHAAVTLVGSRRSADTLRLQRFLTRNGHPVHTLEPGTDSEADARLDAAGPACGAARRRRRACGRRRGRPRRGVRRPRSPCRVPGCGPGARCG